MARRSPPSHPTDRPLHRAVLLSIGSELTVGDTRDTNAGDIARWLAEAGVAVERITALPDRLDAVAGAFAAALEIADLVVSTGGLGPTPDDLTRESIAAVCDETPVVDPGLERWLRNLWARRNAPFPTANLKQAWLIPSAVALANPNGTAPGWFVTRPDGRVIVALPGPPREMRPMWQDEVVPRLRARAGGLGTGVEARTYRLMNIGESQVAEILGDELLRNPDPEVATYARADAVDVRISAVDRPGRPASEAVAAAAAIVEERLRPNIWATGATTWADAIGALLGERAWQLALVEIATGGQLTTLFGDAKWLVLAEVRADGERPDDAALLETAAAIRARAATAVGLAISIGEAGADTDVAIAIATPDSNHVEHRAVFMGGRMGRIRAALATAAALYASLRSDGR